MGFTCLEQAFGVDTGTSRHAAAFQAAQELPHREAPRTHVSHVVVLFRRVKKKRAVANQRAHNAPDPGPPILHRHPVRRTNLTFQCYGYNLPIVRNYGRACKHAHAAQHPINNAQVRGMQEPSMLFVDLLNWERWNLLAIERG